MFSWCLSGDVGGLATGVPPVVATHTISTGVNRQKDKVMDNLTDSTFFWIGVLFVAALGIRTLAGHLVTLSEAKHWWFGRSALKVGGYATYETLTSKANVKVVSIGAHYAEVQYIHGISTDTYTFQAPIKCLKPANAVKLNRRS